MDERRVKNALVCPRCQGLWVDWFDGEVSSVTKQAGSPTTYMPTPPKVGKAACPRCTELLAPERFNGDGPELFRCGACAGLFVTRAAAEALIALDLKPPESAPKERSWLARFLGALRRFFGGRAP